MTTTELTGAEEIAWDLSDLYDGGDDPRLEADVQEAEEAAAAFRDRYYGKTAELSAAELREAIEERERIESILTRAIYFAHLQFATDMADPARGRARRAAHREGRGARHAAPLLRARDRGPRRRRRRERCSPDDELEKWRHWLRSLRKFRPYLLTEPEEKILTEKSVSGVSAWGRLYEELLGAIRVELDGDEIALEEAMSKLYSGDRDLRRRSAEAVTESLAPGLRTRTYVFNTIVLDKSIDDRLRGLRDLDLVPQPAERDERRGRAGARRRRGRPLRRPAALLPPEGEAHRARPHRVLRPLRADRRGPDDGVVAARRRTASSSAYADFSPGDRRHRRAVLRRELDRRGRAGEQADGSVLRDDDPRPATRTSS